MEFESGTSRRTGGRAGLLTILTLTQALLLRRTAFADESVRDHTTAVLATLPSGLLDPGDLLVAEASGIDGQARTRVSLCHPPRARGRLSALNAGCSVPLGTSALLRAPLLHATFHMPGQEYLFASFHGEDHARGTDVVLNALYKLAETMPAHRLVVGVDADTHVVGVPRRHREEPQSQTAPPDTELETAHIVVNKEALKRWPLAVLRAAANCLDREPLSSHSHPSLR